MSVFVDTSALYAVLDADDAEHEAARATWTGLVDGATEMLTTSYVLVESFALVQARLGMSAVRSLDQDLLPLVGVHWVSEDEHRAGVSALMTAARRDLSLVDCVSFLVMRRLGLERAFAFDRDFEAQGFQLLGGG